MAATVTIRRSYFEALLRRAEFYSLEGSGSAFGSPTPQYVTIPKSEHEYLLRADSEYNILRNALLRAGLTQDTLDLLMSEEAKNTGQADPISAWNMTSNMSAFLQRWNPTSSPSEGNAHNDSGISVQSTQRRNQGVEGVETTPDSHEKDEQYMPDEAEQGTRKSSVSPPAKRTILVTNLSGRASHKDLVNVIRGGRLLDLYLRDDKSAVITFVEGAQDFLNHIKRNDIYIHQKLIEARWNNRQLDPSNHIASQINMGATRNLLIRGGAGRLTEEGIRSDLDHIHNLVVIDVKFKDGDAYISTNSIRHALFARSCMMSRATYKRLRIGWYPDECAGPLPANRTPPRSEPLLPKTVLPTITNPFTLLSVDGSDHDSDGHDDDDIVTTYAGFGHGVRLSDWTDATVVA